MFRQGHVRSRADVCPCLDSGQEAGTHMLCFLSRSSRVAKLPPLHNVPMTLTALGQHQRRTEAKYTEAFLCCKWLFLFCRFNCQVESCGFCGQCRSSCVMLRAIRWLTHCAAWTSRPVHVPPALSRLYSETRETILSKTNS